MSAANNPNLSDLDDEACERRSNILGQTLGHKWSPQKPVRGLPRPDRCHWCSTDRPEQTPSTTVTHITPQTNRSTKRETPPDDLDIVDRIGACITSKHRPNGLTEDDKRDIRKFVGGES